MPLFSIIIPTYNRASLLPHTLNSVWGQSFSDFEVIVVDDGSTDATHQLLSGYQGRLRVFPQNNRGPGAARNLGASRASGDYLAFLDSDDVWLPWTLETYRRVISRSQRPAFIAGKPFRFRAEKELAGIPRGDAEAQTF